ncbi:MAG: response regulator [Acidobacteria bacterium]|nr:response regulator [Acidobacteriota bacterium]
MAALQPMVALRQVLLVEDDDGAREMFAAALRLTGYHVRTAADGLAGLRLLEGFVPDVVVLDLGLPIASGFEVLHEIRSVDATKHIPVIAISGHDLGVRLAKANPEFYATIAKPFDPETLVRAVSRAVRQRR